MVTAGPGGLWTLEDQGPPPGIPAFRQAVLSWFSGHRREMPWRETRDPYCIFISEIMLQQTQVSRVLKYYPPFIERFPGFSALAGAPFPDVLSAWQGLGYNRRALHLVAAARMVCNQYGGDLPASPVDLERLPGIGRATAGSVAAFAFNTPAVFIETNIRRVFLHYFFHGATGVRDTDLVPLVSAALDCNNPREWYYALMDLGSFMKGSLANPNRRSSRYRMQAPFAGSVREARGRLLGELGRSPLSREDLVTRTGLSDTCIGSALAALVREGFVVCEKDIFRIRGS